MPRNVCTVGQDTKRWAITYNRFHGICCSESVEAACRTSVTDEEGNWGAEDLKLKLGS